MNVCPLDFGRVDLVHSLAETGSSIETRFSAGRSASLEQLN